MMTNEEAEALIAEIKKLPKYQANWVPDHVWKQKELMLGEPFPTITLNDIEKIIKRFANKPPATGYETTFYFSNTTDTVKLLLTLANEDEITNKPVIIRYRHTSDGKAINCVSWAALPSELKQLRDNCNKMLQYLGGDDAEDN